MLRTKQIREIKSLKTALGSNWNLFDMDRAEVEDFAMS